MPTIREIPLAPIVFVMAIGVAMVGGAAWMWWTARTMETWPATDGVVLATEVRRHSTAGSRPGSSSILFGPHIKYRYTVNGKEHVGERIGLVSWETGNRATVESFLAGYPVGSPVKIQYDPGDPKSAVIPGQHSWLDLIFLLTGMVVIAVSLGLLHLRRKRQK